MTDLTRRSLVATALVSPFAAHAHPAWPSGIRIVAPFPATPSQAASEVNGGPSMITQTYNTGRFNITIRVPPGASPPPTDQDLDKASVRLRFRLPDSYRNFVKVSGSGTMEGAVRFDIIAPYAQDSRVGLRKFCRENRAQLREWADGHEELSRLASDLMPFADTNTGDIVAWLRTEVNADGEYPVYLIARSDSAPHRISESFIGFVEDCCEGKKFEAIFNFAEPLSPSFEFHRFPPGPAPRAAPKVVASGWFPTLPLRDLIIIPGIMAPFFIGRPRSIRAVEHVMRNDVPLVLTFQKDPAKDDVDRGAIFDWGCLAHVYQLLKLGDQPEVKTIVGAVGRVRIGDFRSTAEFAEVEAQEVPDAEADQIDEQVIRDAMQSLDRRAREYNRPDDEVLDMLDDCSDDFAELECQLFYHSKRSVNDTIELLSNSYRSQRLSRLARLVAAGTTAR
jgi:Lon protease-like protein